MATLTSKGLFYTEELGTGLRVAQVLGLTTTAFFAGNIHPQEHPNIYDFNNPTDGYEHTTGKTFSQSFSSTPAFLEAPAPLLAKQWKKMLDSDRALTPSAVAIGASIFAFMAYREPNLSTPTSRLYLSSTLLLLANIPYTLLFTGPLVQKLLAKESNLASTAITDSAAEAGVAHEETVHFLVDRWATANLGNAALTGLAAVMATWAAVDRTEVVPAVARVVGGAGRMGK